MMVVALDLKSAKRFRVLCLKGSIVDDVDDVYLLPTCSCLSVRGRGFFFLRLLGGSWFGIIVVFN